METRPSWLDNILFLLPLVALLIATLFGYDQAATGETSTLLSTLIENIWLFVTAAIGLWRSIVGSVKRWKQDNGLVVNGMKLFVRNPVGTRTV